jgi:hypothetical protein
MAGKTFPGIGELEDESPDLDPADAADSGSSASYYSGPTVVDEAKVEQGLKKLRSLDVPPGPHTGIHRAVADAMADPSRVTPQVPADPAALIPEITVDPARGTAVGRSVSGPLPGQQTTQPFDDKHLRGTMFGHGVHRPSFDPAPRAEEEPPPVSTALAVIERGKPTNSDIAIFQPGPYAPKPYAAPQYAQYRGTPAAEPAFHQRTNRFQHTTPIEVEPLPPRRKIIWRVVAAAACIGLIVVAALLWVRANTEDLSAPARPASVPAARPIDLHPLAPPPSSTEATATVEHAAPAARPQEPPRAPAAAPPTAPAPPRAAAAAKPPAAAARPPATADRDDAVAAQPARPKPAAVPAAPAHHTHAAARRHAAGTDDGSAKPDQGDKTDGKSAAKPDPGEAKPARPKRSLEDDPDATMAPSIE